MSTARFFCKKLHELHKYIKKKTVKNYRNRIAPYLKILQVDIARLGSIHRTDHAVLLHHVQ